MRRSRQERLITAALWLAAVILALIIELAAISAPAQEPARESPSYWHVLDGIAPAEDTAINIDIN